MHCEIDTIIKKLKSEMADETSFSHCISMQIRLRPNITYFVLNILINYFISRIRYISNIRYIKLVVSARANALENVNLFLI